MAQGSPEVERAADQRIRAVLGEAAPDRDHLAVGGRIAVSAPAIAASGDHRAVAHDHRAEWEVGLPGLVERHLHETLVLDRGRIGRLRAKDRGRDGCGRETGK